jgi:TonB family protein
MRDLVGAAGAGRQSAPPALRRRFWAASKTSPLGVVMPSFARSYLSLGFGAALLFVFGAAVCADASKPLELPHLKTPAPTAGNYPLRAVRLNQEGRVLVEFKISKKGRVSALAVTLAEPAGAFDAAALHYVHDLEFDVPTNWGTSGGTNQSFHFGFIFLLRPCQAIGPCEEPAPYSADRSFWIIQAPLPPPQGAQEF